MAARHYRRAHPPSGLHQSTRHWSSRWRVGNPWWANCEPAGLRVDSEWCTDGLDGPSLAFVVSNATSSRTPRIAPPRHQPTCWCCDSANQTKVGYL